MHRTSSLDNLPNPLLVRIAEQDATYASEVAGLRRLIEMVEAREIQSKAIVENVEQEWPAVKSVRIAVNMLCGIRSSWRERLCTEAAEARIEEPVRVLERLTMASSLSPRPGPLLPLLLLGDLRTR
jgi:nucleoprotein TPR